MAKLTKPHRRLDSNKYTPAQLEAIGHNGGPILVVAGAGTGKTAVITQRIARLILGNMAKPQEVLALTFTEKAANEMQQRVDELLPYGYVDTQIMTFHALAERIMREFALDAGVSPEFQILNDVQQTIIFQEVLSRVNFNYFSPQHHPFAFISQVKGAISRLKDEGINAQMFGKLARKHASSNGTDQNESMADLAKIYSKYSELCEAKNSLDFGDLLIKLQHLLKSRKLVKKELMERYKYLLVDEFQDTNTVQMDIMAEMLATSNNIMVVGDDDQAIYSFRGASVRNILNFRDRFTKRKLVVLNNNFRSGQKILDAGYRLIQNNNPDRLEVAEDINKQLVAEKYPNAKVGVAQYANKLDEADGVVQKVQELINDGVEQKNIAILLRKNNQIKAYILALQKKKINYYVHQDVELFDQQSVKILVALANSICDPYDSAAFFQLLISGFFKSADKHQIIHMSSLARRQNKLLYDILGEAEPNEWIEEVLSSIIEWRELIAEYSAGEVLFMAIKSNGYLKAILRDAETSIESVTNIQYMTDFFKLVKQFELVSANTSLVELCKYLDEIKQSSADVMSDISPLDTDGLQIMTIHKAKGLEFDYVFMPELTEQTFPTYRQSEPVKFPADVMEPKSGDHYQEERRLFYVGLTRARQGVNLSLALDHGGKKPKKPSRFIAECLGDDWQRSAIQISDQRDMSELIGSFEPVILNPAKESILNRLYRGEWLYLTTNQIADYLRSPKEFWLFHVLQLPKGPFHSLIYGTSVHAALEHYYKFRLKSRPIATKEVLEVYKSAWKSEGFVSMQHEQTLFETGKKAIISYIKSHQADDLTPVAIEQPFELQLPKIKTVISGRYDIILNTTEGLEIRDFKTSRVNDQKTADKKAKDSIQLGIYALSWEKLQQSPVTATSIEFVQDLYVGKNSKLDHAMTIELINRAVDGIKGMKFDSGGDSKMDFDKLLV